MRRPSKKNAMRTHGSTGPSGLNISEWRRFLSTFDDDSVNRCKHILNFAIEEEIERWDGLYAYSACRLITVNKNPEVRPFCVGNVLRRIISRKIVSCIAVHLKHLGAFSHLYLSQEGDIEH